MTAFNMDKAPRVVRKGMRVPARIKLFIKTHIADQAVIAVAWVIGVFSSGIGLALFVTSDLAEESPPFRFNFDVAPPHVWGFLFAFLGSWVILVLLFGHKPKLPLYFIGTLSGVWGVLTVIDILTGSVPATAFIAYATMGWVAFICGIAFEDFDDLDDEVAQ